MEVPFEKYNSKVADNEMSMRCTTVVKVNGDQTAICDSINFQLTNPSAVDIEVYYIRYIIYLTLSLTLSLIEKLELSGNQ